jgi:hypothetical protein
MTVSSGFTLSRGGYGCLLGRGGAHSPTCSATSALAVQACVSFGRISRVREWLDFPLPFSTTMSHISCHKTAGNRSPVCASR